MKEQRISVAGIIIQNNKILLARYTDQHGKSFLVGPGGGVKIEENMPKALIREVQEETRIEVKPSKILFVEDLLSRKYRMIKIWFLCKVVGGHLEETQEAKDEGIVEVNWYSKEQLKNEVVYPSILMEVEWQDFSKDNWQAKYLELKIADF